MPTEVSPCKSTDYDSYERYDWSDYQDFGPYYLPRLDVWDMLSSLRVGNRFILNLDLNRGKEIGIFHFGISKRRLLSLGIEIEDEIYEYQLLNSSRRVLIRSLESSLDSEGWDTCW